MTKTSVFTWLMLLTLTSCNTRNHGAQSQESGVTSALARAEGADADPAGLGREQPGCGTGCGHEEPAAGCGAEVSGADTRVVEREDPASGGRVSAVGAALGAAPLVSIQALLEDPENYDGKTVRVEGDVSAMCHHRRAWFAVQPEGARDGSYLRVLAAPSFLVPPGSIGRKARAEGKIEVIQVPASAQRHYAAEHGLRDTANAGARGRQVVLRAFGAEFI